MKVINIICAMAMVLSLVVSATAATTHYVAPAAVGGSDANGGTGWGDAWATLSNAVANVGDGDIVLVSNGLYLVSAEIVVTNNIRMKGFMNGVSGGLNVASNTIIQRSAAGTNAPQHRLLKLSGIDNTIEFNGLTFTNGYLDGGIGGAVYIPNESTTQDYQFNYCRFLGNVATNGSGGAIYFAQRRYLKATGCEFLDNVAGDGGAIGQGGSGATLVSCVFLRNRAHNASGEGGGAVAWHSNGDGITFTDCTFDENVSASKGGALSIRYGTYTRTFARCVFRNNHADGSGGAICYYEAALTSYVEDHDIIGCRIVGNTAGDSGGGIYLNNSLPIDFYNNLIVNNAATNNGGGVWAQDLIARQCTITDNCAGGSGGGIYVSDATPGGIVTNSIVYGNTPDTSVNCSFGFSCVPAGSPGVDNVNTEPQFASTEETDYALSETSACVDGGTTNVQTSTLLTSNWDGTGIPVNLVAITADIAGNPYTDFDGDSIAQPNMGCYELTVPPFGTMILIQ